MVRNRGCTVKMLMVIFTGTECEGNITVLIFLPRRVFSDGQKSMAASLCC